MLRTSLLAVCLVVLIGLAHADFYNEATYTVGSLVAERLDVEGTDRPAYHVKLGLPLDHNLANDTRILGVHFYIYPADTPSTPRKALFIPSGGPGVGHSANLKAGFYYPELQQHFDLIFWDARGVGISCGLWCTRAYQRYMEEPFDPEDHGDFVEANVRFQEQCRKEFYTRDAIHQAECLISGPGSQYSAGKQRELLLPFISTRQIAEDMESFRKLASTGSNGYASGVYLYGASYGTEVSQVYAAVHPDHVAGMVLDSSVDHALDLAQYSRTVASDALALSRRLGELCSADAACRADNCPTNPSVCIHMAEAVISAAWHGPVTVPFYTATGRKVNFKFHRLFLENAMVNYLTDPWSRTQSMHAIGLAARGNFAPLVRQFLLGANPRSFDVNVTAVESSWWQWGSYYAITGLDYSCNWIANRGDISDESRVEQYLSHDNGIYDTAFGVAGMGNNAAVCPFNQDNMPDVPHANQVMLPYNTVHNFPVMVAGSVLDVATPRANGDGIFTRLAAAGPAPTYRVLLDCGPHVIYKDNAAYGPDSGYECVDAAITGFFLGVAPNETVTSCTLEQPFAGTYIPLPPRNMASLSARALLPVLDNELRANGDYVGQWGPGMGCDFGGKATFEGYDADGAYVTKLERCELLVQGVSFTGTVKDMTDSLSMHVHVRGAHSGNGHYKYERAADGTVTITPQHN